MQSERESLKKLISPKSKVSSHFFINRTGKIFRLVNEDCVAWHAGKSKWKSYKNLNKNSIGIELVNRGHRFGYQSFTKIQIKKLIKLCKYLMKKYRIKKNMILGHSDVAPLRKIDPGEKFPWKYLSSNGVGIYPLLKTKKNNPFNPQTKLFFNYLNKIGYRYLKTKFKKKIIKNFQRRYRPKKANGILDQETMQIAKFLSKN